MCVLCKDTFSRSDILKRHFQKCSLRRGNPTGASHLSHPQAHLKRSQAAANAAKPVQDEVSSSIPPSNGLVGTTFGEGSVNGQALAATSRPGFTEQQPLGFLMSSVNGMNPSQADQRASWMAAPKQNPYLVQPGSEANGQLNNIDRPPLEQAKPQPPAQPQPPIVQDPKRPVVPGQQQPGQQPGQQPNHTGEIDWTTMFQPGAPDGYMNPVFPQSVAPGQEPINTQVDPDRKFYPATTAGHQDGGLNGLYLASTSLGGDGMRDPNGVQRVEQTQPQPQAQEPLAT